MRRILYPLFLVAVITSAVAVAMQSQIIWSETQATTRAAPTLATEGLDLSLGFPQSVHPIVSCPTGWTLNDAGSVACWFRPVSTARWNNCSSSAASFSVTAAGSQDFVGPEFTITNPFGRLLFASSGITCDGGLLSDGGINTWDGGLTMRQELFSND